MKEIQVTPEQAAVILKTLQKMDAFSAVPEAELKFLLPMFKVEEFAAGETVFKEGDHGDAFYVLFDGAVDIVAKTGLLGLSKRTLAHLDDGNFFGEMALMSPHPRNATVTCTEKTTLLALTYDDFRWALSRNRELNSKVAVAIMDREEKNRS